MSDDKALSFLEGSGEMSRRMRALEWSSSPLGSPESWPQSLRSVVGLMLGSEFPMFVAWGSELGFLYNEPYAEILGSKHPEALGRPFHEIWAEIWPDISPLIDAAMAGQATYRKDLPLLMRRKGYDEETWFTFSYSPVRDESGAVAGMFCACTETTDAVLGAKRRDALLELDDRLRDLENTADLSFAASEILGRLLQAVRAGYGAIDIDAGTISVERNWFAPGFSDLAGVHSFSDYGSYVDDLRRGETVAVSDVARDPRTSHNVKAFERLEIRAHLDVPVVENGRTVGEMFVHSATPRVWTDAEIVFVREVAERTRAAVARRRAERELRDSERDRLWTLSQDMLARADYSGMMSAVSPAWTQVLGWTADELLTRGYATFMHPDDMPPTLDAITRMKETRLPTRFENRIATSDGGWKHIEWTVAPEPDGENFIAVGRDLSDAKKRDEELNAAQELLRQSQKMEAMGSLTGGVAHDFNNLLAPIIGSLDLLQRRQLGSEREQRLIDGALQSAERARLLVQRLLAFARRQPLQPRPVDIGALVSGMAGLVSSTTGPQIQVEVQIANGLPAAFADPNQIEMAILNLSVNARDAIGGGGGTLRISADEEVIREGHRSGLEPGRYVRLSVADTGSGMDEATLARAIEPFFSTKGVGRGTGLGLSMAHGLASQLGGALLIESRPGLGTNVEMWLPATEDAVRRQDAVQGPDKPLRTGKALLVDDEDLVRASTADMLTELGYSVEVAGSAEEALELFDGERRFDLLVTDHLMPGMTGTELARLVRSRQPATRTLVISGYADVDGVAPDLPRLTKPFRKNDLSSKLNELAKR
jgi:PAS domain S-box-containing protein